MFDGQILKNLRVNKNINQSELADILGVTQKNISSYETNRTRPDYEALIKMSKHFNVSVDYLLGLTNENLNSLNDNELYIVKTYRALKEDTKIQFMTMVNMIRTLREGQMKV